MQLAWMWARHFQSPPTNHSPLCGENNDCGSALSVQTWAHWRKSRKMPIFNPLVRAPVDCMPKWAVTVLKTTIRAIHFTSHCLGHGRCSGKSNNRENKTYKQMQKKKISDFTAETRSSGRAICYKCNYACIKRTFQTVCFHFGSLWELPFNYYFPGLSEESFVWTYYNFFFFVFDLFFRAAQKMLRHH